MTKGLHRYPGFTLVELMITLAILSILGAIAVPMYIGYVEEGRLSAVRANVEPLRLALEDFFLENGTYQTGNWLADGSDTTLEDNIGWHPDGDGGLYDYVVTAGAACAITSCYSITVTSTADAAATITCNRNQTLGTFSCP
jgi:prepilin-type N-terminal cleavage/methylation domain-containing protein